MSANRKVHSSIELSREEEAIEKKFTNFSLEKEESCSLIFDENQMKMEPEDHLQNLFSGHFSPPSLLEIKEEASDMNYFYRVHEQKELTLNDHYQSIKNLLQKCRVVKEILFSTSKEPIYSYDLGFETQQSEDEGEQDNLYEEDSELLNLRKEETPHIKEENFQNGVHLLKTEEDSSFGTKQVPGKKDKKKEALIINISSSEKELPELNWVIELSSKCLYQPLNRTEKRKFLSLLEKLNSMKRGICRAILTVNENDHRCKYCGIKFETGRKLGGHISRKHPGNSFEYLMKKEVRKTKICERNRRNYLKNMKEQNQ